jgi:hypothetical protein
MSLWIDLAVAAVIALLAVGLLHEHGRTVELDSALRDAQEATRTAERARLLDSATLVANRSARAATARSAASARASAASALSLSPAWRDEPVPAEVQNALK